jgi:competence protein ComEA
MIASWWWWSGRANVPAAISEIVSTGVQIPGGLDVAAPPPVAAGDGPIVVVHVAGEVQSPGLVELPAGSRVSDAVTAAGGAINPDSLITVNLARPVIDGEQILVGGAEVQASDGRISINAASATELQELPGVGPVLAERIVAFREQNGPFTSLDGLLKVSGIGEATLRNLGEQVRM